MSQKIAIFGGSFNPPGLHHRQIAEALEQEFDHVVVYPCGTRADKPTTNDVDSVFRATMVDLCFGDLPKVEVCLDDLEHDKFSRTHELQERYEHRGEVWHMVGSDLLTGGGEGKSFIHRVWQDGPTLWQTLNFVVFSRPGYEIADADLPPRHRVIHIETTGASGHIREQIFHREPISHLVTAPVEGYIERYGLYRGRIPSRVTRRVFKEPRLLIVADEWNPKALKWAEHFRKFEVSHDPNCVLVIGGDGSMLRAIRRHWRKRMPFLGLNAGHLGFLLNDAQPVLDHGLELEELILRQMPLLYVETRRPDDSWAQDYAFNEAWMERATGQTAWLQVKVGQQVRLPKLVCDGLLLSTPAGSTAYARSMGATPLLAETPAWLLVGSNVMQPANWHSALLSLDTEVQMVGLNIEKRPLNGFVDGVPQGEVREMHVRVSRAASVELAFLPSHDMAEKIAAVQFPQTSDMEL